MADITPIASLNGELAMPEKVWMQGPPGAAATLTVGTVTTGQPGTDAIVTNSGTESAAVLDFTIPRGATGPAGAGVPAGGTVGQLLGKTETGTAWIDPPQSGVQPDWNQNDETQPDYVKNRPFYTGNPVETVLVEESTVTFKGGFSNLKSTFEATAGETYKVSWDGTVYECTCVDFNGGLCMGNQSIVGGGSDTGEPFFMMVINGVGMDMGTTDTDGSHTFSISGLAPEVVKVDEKYLPEIHADKLPTIPADKLPTIPADKLPAISADKLPAFPVIEFTTKISDSIANAAQPHFAVSNLSYAEIYSIVEKGYFHIKDSSGVNYIPIKYGVESSGLIWVAILAFNNFGTIYAELNCSANKTMFYRDIWWQIEATQK